MAVRIVAIKKDGGNHYNPYEAISAYKWINEQSHETGSSIRVEMVRWIESGGRAYVTSTEGTVDCFVNTSPSGTKFVETQADSRSTNNLLNLPEY